MVTTNFIDKETVIEPDWLNDVDNFYYTIFGGATYANQVFNIALNGDVSILDTAGGTPFFLDVSANQLQVGKFITALVDASIALGTSRTGNGNGYIDFICDETFTTYGLRIVRGNDGANSNSAIRHRGTGALILEATDAGSIQFETANTTALTVDSSQNIGIGISTPDTKLHVWNGSAGTVSAFAGTLLTIENSTNAYINILTPNTVSSGLLVGDPEDNNVGQITYNHPNDYWTVNAGAASSVRFDANATAGNTRLLIYDVDNATLERVSVGAADSGGGGYKVLRIPN